MATKIARCPNCMSPFNVLEWKKIEKDNLFICPYCGTPHNMQALGLKANDPIRVKEEEINKIYRMLEDLNFRPADSDLRYLRDKYPDSAKVYFLSALSHNCISYVNSDNDKNWPYPMVPTLNNINFENIISSEFAQKALKLSDGEERKCYEDVFNYVEKVRQDIEKAYKEKQYQFDVFISVKVQKIDEETKQVVLDANGEPVKTTDYERANKLYDLIQEEIPELIGKVFLSERKKGLFTGKEYEKIIFSALHSAKVFILVSNSRFNIDWHWVRNEWMRYLYLMDPENPDKSVDRNFVFVTDTMNLSDIPSDFNKREAIQYKESGGETHLLNFIRESIKPKTNAPVQKSGDEKFKEVKKVKKSKVEKMNAAEIVKKVQEPIDTTLDDIIGARVFQLKKLDKNAPNYKFKRNDVFGDLRELQAEHPESNRIKSYLLLEDSEFDSYEEYLSDLNNYSTNKTLLEKYLDISSADDVTSILDTLIDSVIKSKNLNNNLMHEIYKDCFYPYLQIISKDKLAKLEDKYLSIFLETGSYDLAYDHLEIRRFLDDDSADKYLDAREQLLDILGKDLEKPDAKSFATKLVNEMLEVDPSHVYANWVKALLLLGMGNENPLAIANRALSTLDIVEVENE